MSSSVLALPGGSISIIKPLIGFLPKIQKQLKDFPYEKNVFLMMRFRKENDRISDAIIQILKEAGLKGIRADQPEWHITGDVYNAIAVLYCCKYGIALLDKAEVNQTYSPNVIYELGMMHCLDRECLILKKDSLPVIPFDLLKNLYMPYRGLVAIRTNVRRWLRTKGLDTVHQGASVNPMGETQLEHAAVKAAGTIKKATIAETPDQVRATDLTWKVKSTASKKWTVSWGLKITNKGHKATRYRVRVLFLDKKDFALDVQIGPKSKPVAPGKFLSYKAESTMTPELAERIRRAVATVETIRGKPTPP